MRLKRFDELNEDIDISQDFEGQKEQILKNLDEFMHDYEVFSLRVAPKHYRQTGNHFTELRKLQREIPEFTQITLKERENPYIKKDLDEAEKRLKNR